MVRKSLQAAAVAGFLFCQASAFAAGTGDHEKYPALQKQFQSGPEVTAAA